MALDATIQNSNGDILEIQKDTNPSGYATFVITPKGSTQSFSLNIDKISLGKLTRAISAAAMLIDSAS